MAKQNRNKELDKDYETVDQFVDSREQRADIDEGQTVSQQGKQWSGDQGGQMTGRLQEDRNESRR